MCTEPTCKHRPSSTTGWMVVLATILSVSPPFSAGCHGGTQDSAETTTPGATTDVAVMLDAIPGLTWTEEPSTIPGYARFDLQFEQPADHADPSASWFPQRLMLLHRAFDAPMVLHTTGYDLPDEARLSEPAALLDANQLSVEHRFFTPSRPDVDAWETLTIEQSAEDFHRIVAAFKPYYAGRWIGTGASKGGMTSVYHRRFHPDDVDATVAYVAPLSFGENDPRYIDFLDQVGSRDCRERLSTFQRTALTHRQALLDYVAGMETSYGLTYNILGADMAVEHAVLELPFTFWQYHGAWLCDAIPGEDASDDAIAEFVDSVSYFSMYSDEMILHYEPYYYQAATQLGYPAISEEAVADLLNHPGTDIAETYVTVDLPPTFDSAAMVDIDTWVRTQGERLMFLYGENDPWSAGAFTLGSAQDSFQYVVPEGNHGALLMDLPEPERTQALETIARWGGADPSSLTCRPPDLPAPRDHTFRRPRLP